MMTEASIEVPSPPAMAIEVRLETVMMLPKAAPNRPRTSSGTR